MLSRSAGQADAILVGTGSNRVWRAEVEIIRHGQQTSFNVSWGGISWIRLINNCGLARKILAQPGPAA